MESFSSAIMFYCHTVWMISVQFSRSVMSDSLWPHGLQHARLPCPSPTPRACSDSCPLSRWCYPTISSSVVPFSSCPQSFQHQDLFQWVSSSHQVAKVLELQFQHCILYLCNFSVWYFLVFLISMLNFTLCSSITFLLLICTFITIILNSIR